MEVPLTYPCSICNDIFASKSARDNHIRRICQSFIPLTDLNGTIIRIERTNGIFQCLKCGAEFNRGNHLQSHWKKCGLKVISKSNFQTYEYLTDFYSTIEL